MSQYTARADADISVQIIYPETLPAAVQTAISVAVSNGGPSAVSGIKVTNDLAAGTAFISAEGGSCTVAGGVVICDVPTLGASQTASLTLYLQHDHVEDIVVHSTLNFPVTDPNPGNNSASALLRFVPLLLGNDLTVTERPGGTNATFIFQLSAPSPTPFSVSCTVTSLTATAGADFDPPGITGMSFAAGVTQQTYVVTVLDDNIFEPSQAFKVSVSAAAGTRVLIDRSDFFCVILDNDPEPTLSVSAPATISEADGTLADQGVVRLSTPLDRTLVLSLTSSDTSELTVPSSVAIPAGQTSATFDLHAVDDTLLDGPQVVTIIATAPKWLTASTNITVLDDDPAALDVQAPASFTEGTASNTVRVVSFATVTTNVIVQLTSSDPSELIVPAQVVIPAGQTTAYVPVTVVDDTETDGPQTVTITAHANGFLDGSTTMVVYDNDVHHYVFEPIPSHTLAITSSIPFLITLSARDIDDNVISTYPLPTYLTATGDSGVVRFTPTNIARINNSAWTGYITITNGPNTNVRLTASDGNGHTGQSNPFTVYASAAQQLRITSAQIIGQDVRINFTTLAARNYRLEAASALQSNQWSTVIPSIQGTGSTISVTNVGGAASARHFFRVALQQ